MNISQDVSRNVSQNGQCVPNVGMLENAVLETMQKYFDRIGALDQLKSLNVYEMFLCEVEKPLLEVVMRYVDGNQSNAAKALGLSRGTLHKKLKIYGML